VEDKVRAKAKAYGRQAAELMLHPEQVFRGFLVSTLECQDCLHTSQRVESFLDLSLPVMADKVKYEVMLCTWYQIPLQIFICVLKRAVASYLGIKN
jgi:ubiquitin carboxyl-terminal hydrolase 16/45